MNTIVTLILGLVIIGVFVWGEGYLDGIIPAQLVRLIQALTIILGAALLAERLGVFA